MKFAATFCTLSDIDQNKPYVFRGDLEKAFNICKENEFDGLEIALNSPEDLDLAILDRCIDKTHLQISAFSTDLIYTQDRLSFFSPYSGDREALIDRLKKIVDLAVKYNHAPIIIGDILGSEDVAGCDRQEIKQKIFEFTKSILDYSASRNVGLLFEVVNQFGFSYGKSIKETADFIRAFNSPYIKLLIDTHHIYHQKLSVYDVMTKNADLIGYVHLCDSNLQAIGAGKIEFAPFFQALRMTSYDGYLCSKATSFPTSESVLKQTSAAFISHCIELVCI